MIRLTLGDLLELLELRMDVSSLPVSDMLIVLLVNYAFASLSIEQRWSGDTYAKKSNLPRCAWFNTAALQTLPRPAARASCAGAATRRQRRRSGQAAPREDCAQVQE